MRVVLITLLMLLVTSKVLASQPGTDDSQLDREHLIVDQVLGKAMDSRGAIFVLRIGPPTDPNIPRRISGNLAMRFRVEEISAGMKSPKILWSYTAQFPWKDREVPACALGVSDEMICVVIALADIQVFFARRNEPVDLDKLGSNMKEHIPLVPSSDQVNRLRRRAEENNVTQELLFWHLFPGMAQHEGVSATMSGKVKLTSPTYSHTSWTFTVNVGQRRFKVTYKEHVLPDETWNVAEAI